MGTQEVQVICWRQKLVGEVRNFPTKVLAVELLPLARVLPEK